jgi:hypothetical protein
MAVEAVLVGLGAGRVAEAGKGAVGRRGQAGWSPAVVVDPVGDRVLGDFGLVVGLAEAAADFGGEAALPVGVAGCLSAPVQGADERGDLDGFGVGRSEQP